MQTFIDFNAALKKNPTRSFGIESSADICKMKTEYRSTQNICNCMSRDICNLKAQYRSMQIFVNASPDIKRVWYNFKTTDQNESLVNKKNIFDHHQLRLGLDRFIKSLGKTSLQTNGKHCRVFHHSTNGEAL